MFGVNLYNMLGLIYIFLKFQVPNIPVYFILEFSRMFWYFLEYFNGCYVLVISVIFQYSLQCSYVV